ncbi:MAG: hypothetical protein ABSC72_13885, partial [Methylovirgula sp.]
MTPGDDPPPSVADALAQAETITFDRSSRSSAASPASESDPALDAPPAGAERKPRKKRERRARQRDLFLPLIEGLAVWCAPNREAFAAIPASAGAGVINWPVRSHVFKTWLAGRAYDSLGAVPGAQVLDDICRIIEARANKEGKKQTPWLRVGRRDEVLYIDLCDELGRVVEIRADGWEIVENNKALPFVRSEHAASHCEPEPGSSIDELRGFVNASDDDFALLVAWMIGALRPNGPYPILIINGEHGSGKSALSFRLRSLVDPNCVETQSPPKD